MPDSPVDTALATSLGVHGTAAKRRQIAISALGSQLDGSDPGSAASRLRVVLEGPARPMLVSGDIDGLVSACMLGSVVPSWDVVAILCQSQAMLVHPDVASMRPNDLFGLDVFSTQFDNVSNHVVLYGNRNLQLAPVRKAFNDWDAKVLDASAGKLLAVPGIWAQTQASYEDPDRADSMKYKYPLGTAQLLLGLLETAGHSPRFYDRHYLPWLVANCDGGVKSYGAHAYNAGIWWPVLAGAVGPASLTEQVYQRVATSRPHDFLDAVNRLDRERAAAGLPRWLNDDWNLVDQSVETISRTVTWLTELSGWPDPFRGGVETLGSWELRVFPADQRGQVGLGGSSRGATVADPIEAARVIVGADEALNANFYQGGRTGSRFNWVGRW